MRLFALSISALFIALNLFATDPEGNFVQYKNQDPIPCKSVKFKRSGGNVYKLHYVDSEGKETQLKGKGDCEKIVRFSTEGKLFELIPMDPDKPTGYKRHFQRTVDGYIDIWHCSSDYDNFSKPLEQPTTISYTHVKIGDGKTFKLTNKAFKNNLKDMFQECEETSIYRGYLISRVTEMSELYNKNCAN